MTVHIFKLPGFPVRVELTDYQIIENDLKLKFRIVYNGKAFFWYAVFEVTPGTMRPVLALSFKKQLLRLFRIFIDSYGLPVFEKEVYDFVKRKLISNRELKHELQTK